MKPIAMLANLWTLLRCLPILTYNRVFGVNPAGADKGDWRPILDEVRDHPASPVDLGDDFLNPAIAMTVDQIDAVLADIIATEQATGWDQTGADLTGPAIEDFTPWQLDKPYGLTDLLVEASGEKSTPTYWVTWDGDEPVYYQVPVAA